jgi:hypothetical protein
VHGFILGNAAPAKDGPGRSLCSKFLRYQQPPPPVLVVCLYCQEFRFWCTIMQGWISSSIMEAQGRTRGTLHGPQTFSFFFLRDFECAYHTLTPSLRTSSSAKNTVPCRVTLLPGQLVRLEKASLKRIYSLVLPFLVHFRASFVPFEERAASQFLRNEIPDSPFPCIIRNRRYEDGPFPCASERGGSTVDPAFPAKSGGEKTIYWSPEARPFLSQTPARPPTLKF